MPAGTRRRWVVSSTPRPHFTPGKAPLPILQVAGWAPVPVWTGGICRPHRDSIPDLPARSQSLYRLSYSSHNNNNSNNNNNNNLVFLIINLLPKATGHWNLMKIQCPCSQLGTKVLVIFKVSKVFSFVPFSTVVKFYFQTHRQWTPLAMGRIVHSSSIYVSHWRLWVFRNVAACRWMTNS